MDNYEMLVWMKMKALVDTILSRYMVFGTWMFYFVMLRRFEVLLFVPVPSCEQDLHVHFACGPLFEEVVWIDRWMSLINIYQ